MTKIAEHISEAQNEALKETAPEVVNPLAQKPRVLRPEVMAEAPTRHGKESSSPSPKDDWLKIANFWENFHSEKRSVNPSPVLPKCQYGAVFKKISQLPEVKEEDITGGAGAETVTAAEVKPEANDSCNKMATETKKKQSRIVRFFRRISRATRNAIRRPRQKN